MQFLKILTLLACTLTLPLSVNQLRAADPKLSIEHSSNQTLPRLTGSHPWTSDQALILEINTPFNPGYWFPVYVADDSNWDYQNLAPFNDPYNSRFYRNRLATPPQIPADDSWRNTLTVPRDSFFSSNQSPSNLTNSRIAHPLPSAFVKFTIFTDDPQTVYFQDSQAYPFHYTFAKDKLPPFAEYTSTDFDLATFSGKDQKALLGAVIYNAEQRDYRIQFSGAHPYPPEMIRFFYEQVKTAITNPDGLPDFYEPTRQQFSTASSHQEYFEQHNIQLRFSEATSTQNATYSTGWALGRLRYIQADDIDLAYQEGRLLPTDILLTDAIPAELPYLAGVISLTPATPNSHVAILTQTYQIPFAYLGDSYLRNRVLQYLDTEVIFEAFKWKFEDPIIHVEPIDAMEESVKQSLLELKETPPLDFSPLQPYGAISANVANLYPDDINQFGGKASNFGYLLREIPNNTRPFALAFSFDLWTAFLAQEIETGISLKQHIDQTLAPYSYPVQNLPALYADLKSIRDTIEDIAAFSPLQQAEILDALEPFDPDRKIRFRSSTNVEDSEHFTGAGLYDSKSGCLADDQDGDENGPSLCDPTKTDERGVLRALRKVYSSFYNNNAFLERLRFEIDENQVGMAILAHYSYPDEIELANGVIRAVISPEYIGFEIVSQPGATSVTNPPLGASPELLTSSSWDREKQSGRFSQRQSSYEDYVLEHPTDYTHLATLVNKIATAIDQRESKTEDYVLDFEYKKVFPGILEIKQVREIPTSVNLEENDLFIGSTFEIETHQGEVSNNETTSRQADAHYLKSKMSLTAKSLLFSSGDPGPDVLTLNNWQRAMDGQVIESQTNFLDLPNANYRYEDQTAIYSWTQPTPSGDFEYELRYYLNSQPYQGPRIAFANEKPIGLSLKTPQEKFKGYFIDTYPVPQEEILYDSIFFSSLNRPISSYLPEGELIFTQRQTPDESPIKIETSFYWPPRPEGFRVGYTAPLAKSGQTTITGLTSQPLVLTSPFAQTYAPFHHNIGEVFIYEPALDPNIPEILISELAAQDIQLIYYNTSHHTILYIGADGQARRASSPAQVQQENKAEVVTPEPESQ